jgi:hypothetical protein
MLADDDTRALSLSTAILTVALLGLLAGLFYFGVPTKAPTTYPRVRLEDCHFSTSGANGNATCAHIITDPA